MKTERLFRDKASFNKPYLINERKDTKNLKITETGAMFSFDDDTQLLIQFIAQRCGGFNSRQSTNSQKATSTETHERLCAVVEFVD